MLTLGLPGDAATAVLMGALTIHNLHYYLELMRQARAAIDAGMYAAFAKQKLAEMDRHEHSESVA